MNSLRRSRGVGGFSVLDLLVAMGIAGTLFAVAVPHLDPRRQDVNTFARTLTADLRLARSLAIVGGVHHCVHKTGTGYELRRLIEDGAGGWTPDQVRKVVKLPAGVDWYMWPTHLEFNTRGLQVATDGSPLSVEVWDQFGAYHTIAVWPSGQAYEQG